MAKPIIYVLDDEPEIVDLVTTYLGEIDAEVKGFTRPEAFLEQFDGSPHGCLIMDIQMPGLNGVQVLERIKGWLPVFPVLFISAHANVPITVSIMRQGAFDLVQKPFDGVDFMARVRRALDWSKEIRTKFKEASKTWMGMQSLTQREREIMELLLAGLSSREIAEKLEISRFTVDHHRAHILDKLESPSLSGLTSAVAKAKTVFENGNDPVRLGLKPSK